MITVKLEKCFKDGLLKRIEPSLLKAQKSVETAESHLAAAKELEEKEFHSQAVTWAYAALFHAGRALLYKDGVQEKSHYCLAEYVAQEYAAKGLLAWKLVTALNSFREERHSILYGIEKFKVNEHEAAQAISAAEEMLASVMRIVGKQNNQTTNSF